MQVIDVPAYHFQLHQEAVQGQFLQLPAFTLQSHQQPSQTLPMS